MTLLGLIGYAAIWVSFGLGHSLLASRPMRRWVIERVGGGERLLYNVVAVLHLGLVLAGGRLLLGSAPSFDLPAWLRTAMMVGGIVGVLGLIAALRGYDLGRFSGMTQWRTGRADDLAAPSELLVTRGLHRYVRHPLYTAAILTLWSGASTLLGLSTAVLGTAYLLIGLRFEERKLLTIYGEAYRVYRRRVPALIPFRISFR